MDGNNLLPGDDDDVNSPGLAGPLRLVVRIDKNVVVPSVLSLGTIAAMLLFVHESFLHPSEATLLVPLIFAPMVTAIVGMIKKNKCSKCAGSIEEHNDSG